MSVGDTVYESDPNTASDEDFAVGCPLYAVAGNHGRLRDARRTPLSLIAVEPERGEIEVQIDAFEDRGAKWRLPVWEIEHLQFARGSQRASSKVLAALSRAVERYDRPLRVDADSAAAAQTRRRVGDLRAVVRERLSDAVPSVDLAEHIARREGEPRLFALIEQFLAARDLLELDRQFAAAMVCNPHSGELVKGHAIVLAELGLCPFSGTIVRDPHLFSEQWTRERRAEHIIARLAFAQEVWATCVRKPLTLYRAAATEGPLPSRLPASFVSCTFADAVAASHFAGGPLTTCAVMWRQVVDPDRLFMTFLETAATSQQFKEAEAVLIGDPPNPAF